MVVMKRIIFLITLCFGSQLSAQNKDADIQSKLDIFNSKIQQTEKGERLRWMDSLTTTIYDNSVINNPKFKYDSIARQTIKYAIGLDSIGKAAEHVANLIWYNNYVIKIPKEGILLFNTYIDDFRTIENYHTLARLYLYTADSYEATGDANKPLECYIKVKEYSQKSGNDNYLALSNQFIGLEESNLGKFSEASISYKTAIGLYIKVKDTASIINTKNSLANLYSVNAFHEEALIERNEAIELAKNGITSIGLVALYNGASQDYKITGNPEKQIEYLKVGLDLLKTMPTRPRVAYEKLKLLADLSNAYVDSDSLERAEQTFKVLEALYIKDESGRNRRDYINARKTLAYAKGNYQEALEYSNVYLEIQTERKNIVGIMNAEKSLSEVFKALGNTSNSNTHLLNHYRIKDSISSVQNVKSLAYYQTLYETEKRDLEIIKQGLEIKQLESDKVIESGKKNIRYTILISSLLLMAGVTYYLLERAKRKRKIIAEKLMRSKKELNDFTQQLLVKSKEQDVLKKEFNSLKSLYGEKEELVELQELADSKILTNEDWDNFKLKFKSVYAHFFINFKNNGFKFSDSEERLVALEKLSLKTNEIANMLGISPDSVHTARYRLRKKLNIPKNIDIIEFLNL
jgi:DNA-binding CsgD family transcriptional regulator